jgi:8-oxo-dGTP diphosphatase
MTIARIIPSTLVYVQHGGQTLMLRKARGHQKGKWNGLGGKAEPGETPEACARREVFEESGLTVDALRYRGMIVFPKFDGTHDWYVWIYLATAKGTPVSGSEGELAWVDNDAVLGLNLHEGDRVFWPWLEQHSRVFSARFVYEDGRFKGHEVTFHPLAHSDGPG